jgi:pentapeptide repeat protein
MYQARSEGKHCMMSKKITTWYTRQNGTILGPFSKAIIKNKILIGRLSDHDEVSSDQQSWQLLSTVAELSNHAKMAELERAKINLDERDGFDRRQTQATVPDEILQKRTQERRISENERDIEYRQLRTLLIKRYRQHKEQLFWPLMALFLIMLISLTLALLFPTKLPNPLPNCETPVGPNINWNNCSKAKLDLHHQNFNGSQLRNSKLIGSNLWNSSFIAADLAYADLRFTNLSYSQLQNSSLIGANLKKADLSYADLSNADLSFADLTAANLGGSKLDNTIFDSAIWLDGSTCASGSIGQCIIVTQ